MTLDAKPKTDTHIIVDGDYVSSASSNFLPVVVKGGTATVGGVLLHTMTANNVQTLATAVSLSASGSAVLIATSGTANRIYVYSGFIAVSGTANLGIKFKDGIAGNLTGPFGLAVGETLVLPHTGEPYFVTSAGASFRIVKDTSAQLSGMLRYRIS